MGSLQAVALALAISGVGETVLLDFHADWCGPCRQMNGAVQKLAARGYPIRKVNVDENRRLAEQHHVTGLPCFILLVDGREVSRSQGAVPLADLERMFRQARVAPAGAAVARARAQSPDTEAPEQGDSADRRTFPTSNSDRPLVDVVTSGGGGEDSFADARLLAATVRLKVDDGGSHSVGSGTIVDARKGEALVLTCGHVFRDSQGKGPIEIDLFGPGAPRGLPGKLISYDLQSDVGLVSFRPGVEVSAARIAPLTYNIRPNDAVVNIGCDHGDAPTLRASRVTAINKFLGPPHLIVAGQPVQGRSGGGLFTNDGLLVGVCNAADPADDGGMYAALGAIHAELDRMGLAEMCQEEVDLGNGNSLVAAREPSPMPDQMPAPQGQPSPETLLPTSDDRAIAAAEQRGNVRLTPDEEAALDEIRGHGDDAEVICIVRPLADPRARSEIIVLDRASREFLRQLSDERRVQNSRRVTSDRLRSVSPGGAHERNRSSVSSRSSVKQPVGASGMLRR
ncbi:MAG TPA: trypsin-like peptidase domain-containing protein [Pirellulales bacterium]|nr:trypsin-like peptidase domain-containing protein [Pirellulales bacterium]